MHRLDQDTSGCLLLARNANARAIFQKAFEAHSVEKYYLAIIGAEVEEESGTIDVPLAKKSSAEAGWRMVGDPDGQPATTHWRRVEVRDGRTLVEFRPVTGRTHQIRVHAREAFRSGIVGDRVYGTPGGPMLLHASRLVVPRDPQAGDRRDRAAAGLFRGLGRCGLRTSSFRTTLCRESFLAATGPGGQNVNKVATAVQLRVDVFKLGLQPYAYEQLKRIAGSRMTTGGELLITARKYRTQDANRQDARRRLAEMIADAHIVQAKRKADAAEQGSEGQAHGLEDAARRGQAGARQEWNWTDVRFQDRQRPTRRHCTATSPPRSKGWSRASPTRSPTWPMPRR